MQLATLIMKSIDSGKVTISAGNEEDLEIKAANKRIDINAVNKEFIKEIIAGVREGGFEGGDLVKSARNMLDLVKDVAEDLSDAGITVTFSFRGDKVVTIGSAADSKFSRLMTRTRAVEINSLPKLMEILV
jgi:hypothetical protein